MANSLSAFAGRERGGRLVHDDQPRLADQRAADVDQPVLGGRQPLHVGVERGGDADALGDRLRRRGRSPRQSTSPKRVFLGRPSMMFCSTVMPGTKASSWWMKLMPSSVARCGVPIATGLPSTTISPPSGCGQAGQHLDQRRFAGAVGADQPMHLARHDRQRDAAQRLRAAIRFADRACHDEGGRLRRPHRSEDVVHSSSLYAESYFMASGWSAMNCSTVSLVTSTAGTSTALGCQPAPAFWISGSILTML